MTADQLAWALTEASATTDQGRWQAPGDAIAPARDRALVAIVAGRELARQEMIDALVAARLRRHIRASPQDQQSPADQAHRS